MWGAQPPPWGAQPPPWGAQPPPSWGPPPNPPGRSGVGIAIAIVAIVFVMAVGSIVAVTFLGRDRPSSEFRTVGRSIAVGPAPSPPGRLVPPGDLEAALPTLDELASYRPPAGEAWEPVYDGALTEQRPSLVCAPSAIDVNAGHIRRWVSDGDAEVTIRVEELPSEEEAVRMVEERQDDSFIACLLSTVEVSRQFGETEAASWELEHQATGGGAQEFLLVVMGGARAEQCEVKRVMGWVQQGKVVASGSIETCAEPATAGERLMYDLLDLVARRAAG